MKHEVVILATNHDDDNDNNDSLDDNDDENSPSKMAEATSISTPSTSTSTSSAHNSVLAPSQELPPNSIDVKGPDFNHPIDLLDLLQGYETIGFQATGLARAIKIVEEMVGFFSFVRPSFLAPTESEGESHLSEAKAYPNGRENNVPIPIDL